MVDDLIEKRIHVKINGVRAEDEGTYWYGAEDPEGTPVIYARIQLTLGMLSQCVPASLLSCQGSKIQGITYTYYTAAGNIVE